ncbi:Glycosyltransferase sugar-binding region containing DXD motif-containing protein [Xylanibacter ruminicola]|uniref:Glycosyltransferase sugar-binding region containing DXD motif-containing protein n=1 Tax=Xylanibacter ruminicola TaxID=839 RepID=A0A1H4DJJ7_XYLRU|nr:glycosyltransferase [Xylanibacter ruminicola]SEA72951.1 Glycosyltransferase sugar-binding region containing DXD motif-containing protein [Xylanibacter ruminicola]
MIPKVIHYCWFGRNPLPVSAQKCIASWKKYLPDYEIKEWNEDNFDVNIIPYTKEAYEAKKYAFVSDYARFWILYHYGGVYFDTDVEVIKPMNAILDRGAFLGIEQGASLNGAPMVAPGLGMGAQKGQIFYKDMLDHYASLPFLLDDGTLNTATIVEYTTYKLYEMGMDNSLELQHVGDVWIYPADVFCPMDSTTGIVRITDNTVSIHHYDSSWMDRNTLRFKLHLLKNFINQSLFRIGILK